MTQPPPPPPGVVRYGPGMPVPPPKRKGMSAIAIIGIIVGVCCGLGAIGAVINAVTPDPKYAGSQTTGNPAAAVETTASAPAAPTSAAPPPPPPSPAGPATTFGPGMYEVGVDIKAGTYTCTATNSLGGYWERAKNASGEFGAIIANDAFDGKSIVTIKAKEFFKVTAAECAIR